MNIYNFKHLSQPPKLKKHRVTLPFHEMDGDIYNPPKNKEPQESYLSCSSNKQMLESSPLME
ncbi:hypothetical protein GCM10023310_27280 [Paenibacillus vulneris]